MSQQEIDRCVICQEDLCDNIYELPECSHKYHTNCIMHWFRSNHNNCPLCQNQGINYNQALSTSLSENYIGRNIWKGYYKEAANYARKKNADAEIVKRVKSIQKTIEKDKQSKKDFRTWKGESCNPNITNNDIHKQYVKFRTKKWRTHRNIWRRKVAIGYLYFHKCKETKLIIAEKVQIN